MESLYAYYSDPMRDEAAQHEGLNSAFDHILDLYYHQLSLLVQLRARVEESLERGKLKKIPSENDLNPNMRFVNNAILVALKHDDKLRKLVKNKKIDWKDQEDLINKTARGIRETQEYAQYLSLDEADFEDDRKYLKRIFKRQVMENELWDNYYSEGNLYWASNIDIANRLVLDTIDDYKKSSTLPSSKRSHVFSKILSKEEETFVNGLFNRTIKADYEYETMIAAKAKNWESDRIATVDLLLMKMAICEFLKFPKIPVKVSMNEYIEISKQYSAPESKGFINGILDKLINYTGNF
ncbi:MAG: transcription antitermination factor NusB [Flavobacteriales bacterium]|nr:transcription antitermination factor NusB [Flavobacteriales bacterium]